MVLVIEPRSSRRGPGQPGRISRIFTGREFETSSPLRDCVALAVRPSRTSEPVLSPSKERTASLASRPVLSSLVSAIAPTFCTGKEDYERRWKELNKKLRGLNSKSGATEDEQYKINEEVIKTGDEMDRLTAFNTTLTVGHLNRFKEELDQRLDELLTRLHSLDERLNPED
jgi:hypothetical protein